MVQQTTKKSNKKSAVERVLTILAGICKASGQICAKVKNDKGVCYFPRINADGTGLCNCDAYTKGRGKHECYHVKYIREFAYIFGPEGLRTDLVAEVYEERGMKDLAAKVQGFKEKLLSEAYDEQAKVIEENRVCKGCKGPAAKDGWCPTCAKAWVY